ncbi:MAG: DNA-directed RNA polymerase subunit A' [Candidatus Woesearchaeota archaeon]
MEPTPEQISKKIKSIRFGVFSPEMIKDMAAAKVVTPELYDMEGYPVDGGLMDTRLGVIDPGIICKTDGQRLKDSLGHFGYISLARPVIHVKFGNLILDLLRTTCRECARSLIPDEKREELSAEFDRAEKEAGFSGRRAAVKDAVRKLRTVTKCPHCKAKQRKISLERPTTYLEDDRRISPIEVRTRLEKITDDDMVLFGMNPEFVRPEWLVQTILSIPPVTVRPSITLESGERSEDDLTHKLGDIVRINQRLFENINAGAPEIIIEDLWDLLQYHVTTYYDNEVSQLPPARHRSGQPLKTLTARIKSKEGRIRHNLAGKRTNFSARTVVSPDPKIELNEVGIPQEVAMKLTVPERVTEWNMNYLKRFINQGPKKYPGSNYIIRPDGKKMKITDETQEMLLEEIQPGFVVERHLLDGDITLFNRQPSLHKMSMMAHRVRVLPGKTFRLHPAVCAPYNADFDGDEMNLHVPQTEEARAEAEVLLQVQTQIISPRYGLSIIGCNQDAITGNYLLTKYLQLPREKAVDLLAQIGVTDFSQLPKDAVVSGKDVFSVLLPEDFDFKGETRTKEAVVIKHGRLIEGYLDKANLGEGAGLMLRNIHKKYGEDEALDILGKFYRLGVQTLLFYGFSFEYNDIVLSDTSEKEVAKIVDQASKDVDELIKKYKEEKLDVLPGRTAAATLELRILERLNKARNDTGAVAQTGAREEGPVMTMATSGARGSVINMSQMSACVGQQSFRGGRIERGYQDRTLSCFAQGDLKPAARGFIEKGFRHGMKPWEFFFMAMTGRDSLMDTALRTPKSGYLYRRLANALQDIKVEKDGTVRDAGGRVVQFSFGEDGLAVAKTRGGKLDVKKIVDQVMEE